MPTRSDIIRTPSTISPVGGAYLAIYTQDNTIHNNYEVVSMIVVAGSTNINTNEYVSVGWGIIPDVSYWKIA